MNYVSNNLFSKAFFTAFLLAVSFALMPIEAKAAILSVNFTPDPLFTASNFLPQDAVSGTVEVQNTDTIAHDIVTEAINVNDGDGFGDKLHLVITDGNSTYFDGGFGSFLSSGATTALGSIASQGTKTFTYAVSFVDTDDNTYQGKTLGFDLCVGFSGGTSQCGDTVIGAEGTATGEGINGGGTGSGGGSIPGSGGGGGPIPGVSLELRSEQVTSAGESGAVLIEWDTNLYATSQVIYGLASGTYVLDLVAPYDNFYGYPFGTVESMTKVLHHAVEIDGLNPGETYKYRVVSRASPPTTSFERQFILAKGGGLIVPAGSAGSSQAKASGNSSGADDGSNQTDSITTGDIEDTSVSSEQNGLVDGMANVAFEDSAENTADAGTRVESKVAAVTDSRTANLAALVGIPAWISNNLSCIAYALLLFGVIFFLWKRIERGYSKGPAFSESGLIYRRRIQFLLSACVLASVAVAMLDWCLLWPFVAISFVALLVSIISKK